MINEDNLQKSIRLADIKYQLQLIEYLENSKYRIKITNTHKGPISSFNIDRGIDNTHMLVDFCLIKDGESYLASNSINIDRTKVSIISSILIPELLDEQFEYAYLIALQNKNSLGERFKEIYLKKDIGTILKSDKYNKSRLKHWIKHSEAGTTKISYCGSEVVITDNLIMPKRISFGVTTIDEWFHIDNIITCHCKNSTINMKTLEIELSEDDKFIVEVDDFDVDI